MLKIYNTLSREKQIFKPVKADHVGIYVCGVTVYDYCHIGHARPFVVFDVVHRYLKMKDLSVTFVRNITDIDDKIIQRANERNISIEALTDTYTKAMHEDFEALNILPSTYEPRATAYIPQMIRMIEKLIANEAAYLADNGDVYFKVSAFADYGALSHKDLEGLAAGIRIEVDAHKENPMDFVLWKSAKANEPHWDSPWGKGRPGWHIECSAMSCDLLGETFDIHGGGADLQFPHHENEIAQAQAANQKTFAQYWMHVGLVNIDAQKMSKSLGNFFTIKEVLDTYKAETARYFLLSAQYRSPLNYSNVALDNAEQALTRIYMAYRDIEVPIENLGTEDPLTLDYRKRFCEAMDDDFNTPVALAVVFDLIRDLNKAKVEQKDTLVIALARELKYLTGILGIGQQSADSFLQASNLTDDVDARQIEHLLTARHEARKNKDWQKADEIRDTLSEMGIVIEDSDGKTTWRKI